VLFSERNSALDDGHHKTNPFAATRGDKTAMRPSAKLIVITTTNIAATAVTIISIITIIIILMKLLAAFTWLFGNN